MLLRKGFVRKKLDGSQRLESPLETKEIWFGKIPLPLWKCKPKTLISTISQWVCPDPGSVRTGKTRKQAERSGCIVSAQLLGHINEERDRLPK